MHKGTIIVYDQPSAVVRHVEERTKNNGWNVSIPATRKALQKALLSQNDALIALLSRSTCDADFDLIDEARKFNPLIRIILILDQWDLKDVRRAMNKGAFDIIRQPVDLQSVTCAIEKALNQVMTGMIARQTKQELYLIHKELEIAARIQRSILPSDIRQVKSCAVFAEMLPAKEIAGDFYDYFVIDETRSAFVIGDVSGKGIPAALFMAVCRSLVKSTALQGWAPAECMSHVNRVLCEDNPDAMFVTLFYGILDSDKNRLDYCTGRVILHCLLRFFTVYWIYRAVSSNTAMAVILFPILSTNREGCNFLKIPVVSY